MRFNRSGYTAGARVRHRLWCRRRLGVLEPETARRWRCSFEFVPIPSSSITVTLSGSEAGLRVIQFTKRHWSSLGCNGETFSDRGYQSSWEVSRAQPGTAGILVDYTGGEVGASFGSGTPTSRAQQFLAQVEPVLPGLSSVWNGRATVDFWAAGRSRARGGRAERTRAPLSWDYQSPAQPGLVRIRWRWPQKLSLLAVRAIVESHGLGEPWLYEVDPA